MIRKPVSAKVYFHNYDNVTVKEARTLVGRFENITINYSGHDGSIFLHVEGPESAIRSLLVDARVKVIDWKDSGMKQKDKDMKRERLLGVICKHCTVPGNVWIGYTKAKVSYHCRACDVFWDEYKVFDKNWDEKEIGLVRSFLTSADDWRWFKGRNLYSAWPKGTKNLIIAKDLSSLIDKVGQSIVDNAKHETN